MLESALCAVPRESYCTKHCTGGFLFTEPIHHHSTRWLRTCSLGPVQVEASLFLRNWVPTSAIYHLRSLDIIFPPFEDDCLLPDSASYQRWLLTLSYLAQHANLPKLMLTVRMSGPEGGQGRLAQEMYTRTLTPLVRLTGLQDLYIHLAYPRIHREHGSRIDRMEQCLEQMVMGTGYDSKARGKGRLSIVMIENAMLLWPEPHYSSGYDFM